ncbi:MAG: hypothetical protein ABI625_01805 [bacterium]
MRPNSLIVQKYLTRAGLLWVGARLLVSAAIALGGEDPTRTTFVPTMMIVIGSFALCVADVYRRHERALLENLAVSRMALVAMFASPALLGELGIALIANGWRP